MKKSEQKERQLLPDNLSRALVIAAINRFNDGVSHAFAPSIDYDLVFEGKPYPPKAIVGIAAQITTGKAYRPRDFTGGIGSKCFRLLEEAGFVVSPKVGISANNVCPFKIGEIYNRQDHIHADYRGQEQGGISTPKGKPFIFLFTGDSGDEFGYQDEFHPDGTFWFTGEGQLGDMTIEGGNKATLNHEKDGKKLFLFEYVRKGWVRFVGEARCLDDKRVIRPDKAGVSRSAIIFQLEILAAEVSESSVLSSDPEPLREPRLWSMSEDELEELARRPPSGSKEKLSRLKSIQRRAEAVRVCVLRRANGICDSCGEPAPFLTKKERPYLEPHHMTRLADGGPDHPEHVAACCPDCHREIHFGKNGARKNEDLKKRVLELYYPGMTIL